MAVTELGQLTQEDFDVFVDMLEELPTLVEEERERRQQSMQETAVQLSLSMGGYRTFVHRQNSPSLDTIVRVLTWLKQTAP